MHYVYLAIAVVGEVIATSALKATQDFTKLWPSVVVLAGYSVAFYCLTLSLKAIPVGLAYAIWAGMGIVLVTVVAALIYKQIPDVPAIIGMALIISGVLIIHLYSKSVVH